MVGGGVGEWCFLTGELNDKLTYDGNVTLYFSLVSL